MNTDLVNDQARFDSVLLKHLYCNSPSLLFMLFIKKNSKSYSQCPFPWKVSGQFVNKIQSDKTWRQQTLGRLPLTGGNCTLVRLDCCFGRVLGYSGEAPA